MADIMFEWRHNGKKWHIVFMNTDSGGKKWQIVFMNTDSGGKK